LSTSNDGFDALKNKFESVSHVLETKAADLNSSKLFGLWENEFPVLIKGIVKALGRDVKKEIYPLSEEDMADVFSSLNHRLDSLVSLIESTMNTICRNSAIHEFISYSLRDLGFSKKIPYLLCIKPSMETISITSNCETYFSGPLYPTTNEFLRKYKKRLSGFWIINLPPSVLENKPYWSLLIHEIGHILNESLKLVENYNDKETNSGFTQKFRNYNHGREFISDYIANTYCGPVFYKSLYEHLGRYGVLHGNVNEHPRTDARFFFMQEKLKGIIDNPKKIKKDPKIDHHDMVENLDKIITDTRKKIFKNKKSVYKKVDSEINKAIKQLEHLVPFLGEPTILLNAYSEKENEILKEIEQRDKEMDIVQVQNKVGRIIEDSIRLKNMKRTFEIME